MTTLLLHGFTGHADSFREVIAGLSNPECVRAVTLYAHAFERDDFRPTTFESEVDRIAELIRRELAPPVRVAGYSLGGRIALGLSVRHPALVRAAILISTYPGVESDAERTTRALRDREWSELAEQSPNEFFDAWGRQALFETQKRLPEAVRIRQEAIRRRHSGRAMSLALRSLAVASMPNYWPELGEIAVPVRIGVGELDDKFRRVGERMATLIPHATLSVVPGAGHNVVLERPDAVMEWLELD